MPRVLPALVIAVVLIALLVIGAAVAAEPPMNAGPFEWIGAIPAL